MRNRLTFANVIGVLLENKKKTYPQHQLVRSLFSAYLDDTLTASELIADDTTMYIQPLVQWRPPDSYRYPKDL